jgi:hypothetical protein
MPRLSTLVGIKMTLPIIEVRVQKYCRVADFHLIQLENKKIPRASATDREHRNRSIS